MCVLIDRSGVYDNEKKKAASLSARFSGNRKVWIICLAPRYFPEELIEILGVPDPIEVCASGEVGGIYRVGDPACFPLIVPYGNIEFHFDSPSTFNCIFYDNPFAKKPFGNAAVSLRDTTLLKYRQPIGDFLDLCKSIGLAVDPLKPHSPPYGFVIKTAGSVEVGFEVDDLQNQNEEATLRWFCLKPCKCAL